MNFSSTIPYTTTKTSSNSTSIKSTTLIQLPVNSTSTSTTHKNVTILSTTKKPPQNTSPKAVNTRKITNKAAAATTTKKIYQTSKKSSILINTSKTTKTTTTTTSSPIISTKKRKTPTIKIYSLVANQSYHLNMGSCGKIKPVIIYHQSNLSKPLCRGYLLTQRFVLYAKKCLLENKQNLNKIDYAIGIIGDDSKRLKVFNTTNRLIHESNLVGIMELNINITSDQFDLTSSYITCLLFGFNTDIKLNCLYEQRDGSMRTSAEDKNCFPDWYDPSIQNHIQIKDSNCVDLPDQLRERSLDCLDSWTFFSFVQPSLYDVFINGIYLKADDPELDEFYSFEKISIEIKLALEKIMYEDLLES